MRFFKPRSGKKTITHTHKSVAKAGKAHAPGIEFLEARINPTDVIASTLLFRGDLIADGNLWKSTGSPIEVGFNPTQGEAFRSLVTLKGDTILDPAASKLDFQGVGAFASPSGLVDFWSSTTLSTFDIQKLVSVGGETIVPTSFVVSGLNFKPGNLRFDNPNGGSTNDSILATQGRLELPLLSGFGVDVVDSNSVKIDPTQGIDLTGISTKLSGGSFKAGGASFETSGLTIGYAIQEKTFSVYGSAKVSFGANSITTSFGDSATPGLSIANGDISTFNASLSGSFSLSGTTITADKLALSYARPDDTLNITGGASIAFGSNTASLALNNKGIVIQAGLIQSIDATVDGQFAVAGAAITLNKLTVAYARPDDTLNITGGASIAFGSNTASLSLNNKGLEIKDGSIQSIDATVDGQFAVAGAAINLNKLTVAYARPSDTLNITGGASITFGSNTASLALNNKGLEIKDGSIQSIDATVDGQFAVAGAAITLSKLTVAYARPDDTLNITGGASIAFGSNTASLALNNKGIVIQAGLIQSIDATVDGQFAVAGAAITLSKLTVAYARPDDTLNITGGASIAFGSNTASLALNNKGIVIQAGLIQSIDATVDGQFTVAGAAITLSKLTVAYARPDDTLNITGGASIAFGSNTASLALNNKGLVIQAGLIQSIDATVDGQFAVAGAAITLSKLTVAYARPDDTLNITGGASIAFGSNTASLALNNKGIVIQAGLIQSIDATVDGQFTVAGAAITLNKLTVAYARPDDTLNITGGASIAFGSNTASLSLNNNGIVIQAGLIQSIDATVDGQFAVAGAAITLSKLTVAYARPDDTLNITGGASIAFGSNTASLALNNKGLVIQAGLIQSIDATVDGQFTVAGAAITLNKLTVAYARPDDTLNITGGASIAFGSNTASLALNNKGIVIQAGLIQSIDATVDGQFTVAGAAITLNKLTVAYARPDDTLNITGGASIAFGSNTASLALNNKGIVIQAGLIQSIDATVDGQFTVAGAAITLNKLTVAYARPSDTLNITGGASIAFGSNTASLALNNKGLEIKDGSIQSIDATVDGQFAVAGAAITLSKLTVAYARPDDTLNITGGASIAFGSNTASLSLNNKGLVIQAGSIVSLDASISGKFQLSSLQFEAVLVNVQFVAATPSTTEMLEITGDVTASLGSNTVNLKLGEVDKTGKIITRGIVIQNGELERADINFSSKLNLGPVGIETKNAGLSYNKTLTYKDKNGASNTAIKVWSIYGSASITIGLTADFNLGDKANPGIIIVNGDFELKNLAIEIDNARLGFMTVNEARIEFANNNGEWLASATADISFPMGFAVKGNLNFKSGKLDSVGLAVNGKVAIPGTPLFVTTLVAQVQNISNPSNLVVSGGIGISVGSTFQVGGKAVSIAYFFGSFKASKDGLLLEANAYLFAWRSNGDTNGQKVDYQTNDDLVEQEKKAWSGAITVTGTLDLNWAKNIYKAQLKGDIWHLITLDATMYLNGSSNDFVFRSTARIHPEDGSTFDFFPLNKIDVSGTFLLIKTNELSFVGGWATVDLYITDVTAGVGYNFNTGKAEFIDGSKATDLTKAAITATTNAGNFKSEEIDYSNNYAFETNIPNAEEENHASSITFTVPFITIDNLKYMKSGDGKSWLTMPNLNPKSITFTRQVGRTLGSKNDFSIRDLCTFTTPQVSLGAADAQGYRKGTITYTLYPFLMDKTDFNTDGSLSASGMTKVYLNRFRTFGDAQVDFSGGANFGLDVSVNTPNFFIQDAKVIDQIVPATVKASFTDQEISKLQSGQNIPFLGTDGYSPGDKVLYLNLSAVPIAKNYTVVERFATHLLLREDATGDEFNLADLRLVKKATYQRATLNDLLPEFTLGGTSYNQIIPGLNFVPPTVSNKPNRVVPDTKQTFDVTPKAQYGFNADGQSEEKPASTVKKGVNPVFGFAFNYTKPEITLENDYQLVNSETNSFTNNTSISIVLNKSETTLAKARASFYFITAEEALANQWIVQVTGGQSQASGAWTADAQVVQRNRFTPNEISAGTTQTSYSPEPDKDPSYLTIKFPVGAEVIFLEKILDGSGYTVSRGTVSETQMQDKTLGYIIRKENGSLTSGLTEWQIKPQWLQMAPVKIQCGSRPETGSVWTASARGETFEAPSTNGMSGAVMDYLDLKNQVFNGVIPAPDNLVRLPVGSLKTPSLLPRIQAATSQNIQALGLSPEDLKDPAKAWMWQIASISSGNTVHLTQIDGKTFDSKSELISLGQFTRKDFAEDVSFSGTFRWEELELPPDNLYAFFVVDDGINQPVYSDLFQFNPSPNLRGKVTLKTNPNDANSPEIGLSGLRVFVDSNNNEKWDKGEWSRFTDSHGGYGFYDLHANTKYSIGVELPFGVYQEIDSAQTNPTSPYRKITMGTNPVTSFNFRLKPASNIVKGNAFVDTNNNKLQDLGEAAPLNMTAILEGVDGTKLESVLDQNGGYSFVLPDEFRAKGPVTLVNSKDFGDAGSVEGSNSGNTKPETGSGETKVAILEDIPIRTDLVLKADSVGKAIAELPRFFNELASGQYTSIALLLGDFKFYVDSYSIRPSLNDGLQGLASAKGRAEYKGQNLFYEISGGLLFDGENRLKSFSLKLYGNLDFNGVNLNLDSLAAIYQAADIATGNEAKFQLLGATTINFDGNQFGLALNGDGLVITADGFQSISGKISGKLNIGGEPLDLGSLSLNYDRPLGRLRLTGKTSISKLGDQDNYIALDNVVLEIGKVAGGNEARLQRLEGNLAAGLKMSGIDFDVSNLSFAWLPDSDAFRISGKTTLKTDDKSVDLSAELLDDGITFSKNGVTFNARVNGNLVLGDSGYSVSVTDSGATYSDGKLGFQFNGNLATLLTGKDAKEEIARVQGSAYWTNSKLERISGFASGKIGMNNAVAEFDQIGISYDGKQGAIALSGKANLSLLENGKSNNVLSVDGSISLSQSKVQEFKAKVDTGEWSPTDGITIKLVGLNVAYNSALGKFGLSGACDLKIKDDTQGISLPGDGIVWANGSFQSFYAGLTGSITLQKDTAGKRVSYLEAQNANFGFISPDSFSLGGSFKGVFGSSAGAQVTIGPGGITIDNDGIRSFDAAITAVANFGETFEDKDGDFIYNPAKDGKYNDSNANGVYDFGFGIRFQDAGLVYTRSQGSGGPSIALRGLGVAAFNSEFLSGANSKGKGIAIDLATPGIVIADGKLTDFSFGITTSFDLKGLTVDQASMGARWLSSTKEMAFWGGAGITIAGKNQGLNFGNSQSPGIRLIDGVITEATASLALGFNVGDLKFELKDTGFTYHGAKNEWAIFGSASLSNIFSVSVGLGTRQAPGLFIRDNDWEINNLTLALAKINLGAFSLDEASLSINRIGGSWSVYAACGVTLPIGPGVGARGEFSLVNGKVDLISVTLASATGINIPQTPLFINYISAGIRNLSNLSQITLTGSIGIGLGTSITVFGKTATTAQFVGTCTLDPQSLRIQVDAYFGGINSGTLTQPKWKGLLAEGTGIIFLDWSRGQYYADLNLSFLAGVFVAKGRFSISDINGLVFRSTAKVQIPEDVPLLGGTTLASANFLFVYNPNRSEVFAMAWGDIPFLGTYGLKYDVTPNKFSVLNDDNIKATLAKSAASNPLLMNQLATPALQSKTLLTSSLPENVSVGPMLFSMATATSIAPTREYSGQSDSIPVTEVSEGLYQASFQVKDNSQWAKQSSQKNWIQFLIDPIDGLKIETLPLEFDAETGIGTIGVRVLPPDGQYLPRGLVLRSRLQSPVELTGPGGGDPELESHWTQAYSYGGKTLPVGFDKQLNPPPEGLKVREGRFTISYRPMPDSSGRIAADWLESIRLYLDPVDGVSFKVSQPYFDAKTNKGWVVILASKDDGSFLDEGMRFTGAIRSKVALGNPEDESGLNDGEVYPLLGIRWNTDPVVVDLPTIPNHIPSGIQTTTLTGHVNDPRIREVLVSLYFSTDYAGDQEYLTRLAANGNPAAEIPVMVNSDGSWSTEITWEASSLPKGELWLYGLAKEGITSIPVYGESAGPFQVIRPITGKVTDIQGPYNGLPVFADLNNDEIWQSNEPRSITDNDGNYALDVPKTFASTNLVYDIPAFFRPEDGLTRSHIVDLSNGPVNDNIRLLPTQSILRGSVFVTGDLNVDGWFDSLGQSVSGVGVILSGPNGFMLRTSTNNRGQYELPVDHPGNYTLSLDLVQSEFLGFTLGEMDGISTTRHITIPNGQPDILIQDPLRVDSIAFVTTTDPRGHGSLASLIDLANQGFVRTINFDESLRGKTIDITMAADSPPTPYYLWDSIEGKWNLVTPEIEEQLLYGQTAFILDDDLRISGGDLGITLREAYASTNLTEGYRAFYVQPGVEFLLENITLEGFTSHENSGNNGQTGDSTISAGGAAAGGGGAILNRGITSLNNVHLVGNSALAGNGGNSLVPAYLFQTENPGEAGVPLGTNGTPLTGGTGGGYKGGLGGQAYPVTFTYSIGDDPTILTKTVMIAGAGGGGSGLGGAIYNATGATLNITGGSSFTDNHVFAGKAGTAPEFITNLANALFGDSARTISVSGFEDAWKSFGQDGLALGGAIFNKGTLNISDSTFTQNSATDAGGAIYSVGGVVSIQSTAIINNMSTTDQGVHVVPDAHNNANLDINNSLIKGKQSPFSGKPMGPAAVVVEGGQSSGSGNIISSHAGFQGKSFNSKIVPRPKSPFTGEVFIPLANGPQIDQGALAKIPYLVGNPLIEVAKPFELTFAIPSQPGQPVPSGRVILGIDATPVGQGYIDAQGKVTIRLPGMVAKKVTFDVYYEGDGLFAGNTSKKTIAIGTHNQRIVQELYQDHLGRDADAAGLRQWTERLDSGIPLEQVVRELRLSTEASQRVVQSAFNEILGRDAHTQGLNGWTRYLQSGHTANELRGELFASGEYQSTHTQDDSINSIYRTFIGRDASQAGIESWLKNWEAGMSLSQIISKIENSRESREHIVDSLYQEILNRPADGIGLREWTDSLEQGIDEDALTAALLRSPEFAG